jgi:hypothetical protein
MPIPASQIVEVNPRIITPGGTDLEFNALFLSSSSIIPLSQFVLSFTSATDVGAYFGIGSNEYALAATYFQGFNNSQAKPSRLLIAPRVSSAQAAFVRSGKFTGTIASLRGITSGTFNVTLGGYNVELSNVSLASINTESDVAEILQTAIRARSTNAAVTSATVAFADDAFTITSGSTGEDNTFSTATGTVAVALALDADSATVNAGSAGTAASLAGAEVTTTLADVQAITNGTLNMTINGFNVALAGIDFSEITSIADAASILQTAIRAAWNAATLSGATVAYSPTLEAFTVTSGTAGVDGSVDIPSGTIATALNYDASAGAVISAGSQEMTPAENMEAVLAQTRNFVTFMSIAKLSEADCIAFSAWAATQGVNYLHVFWDDSEVNVSAAPSGTIAQALTDANAGSVCGIYGSAQYAAFICSCAACIDYDRTNGTITFMFKGQSGLAANVQNGTVASNLDSIGMNFIGNYATRNDAFVFLANGEMWGDWRWIDAYLNAVWLNNALQVACMTGFQNNLRVPYTEEGYTIVRAWCMDPINRALRSGVIEPGVTLSESQKAQLQREAGKDISQQLYSDGYYLKVEDPSPAVRQNRGTPECSLWYCYGGSVHKLEIASTAVV